MKQLAKWVLIGFALFVFFLFFLGLRVMVEVRIGGEKSWLNIEINLWRKLIRREFSLGEAGLGWEELLAKNGPILWDNVVRLRIAQGLDFKKKLDQHFWMKKLLSKGVRVRVLRWKTIIGLGDPMSTAIATGLIWGIKGGALVFLSGLLTIPANKIQVSPNYEEKGYESDLLVEFNLRVSYLLLFAAGAYIMMRSIGVNNRTSVPQEQPA